MNELPRYTAAPLTLGVLALFTAVSCLATERPGGEADLQSIAGVVAEEIEAGRIPGAVVLVGHQGRIVYRRAFGDRRFAPDARPMTPDTIFDLASLTKVVATTTAVMQLVEQGKLGLDEPAARHWPRFASRGKKAITLRQLLTHYSGLQADLDLGSRWTGRAAAIERIEALRPVAPPGSRFLYSDVNFTVLGELVQRVAGQPLEAYCAEHLFAPLAMRDTGFRPAAALGDRIASPLGPHGAAQVSDPTARRMGGVAGHAGLFSSADDLAIFAEMLLDGGAAGGARVVDPISIARMTAPQTPPGTTPRRGLGWDIDSPYAADWASVLSEGTYGHTGYPGTSLWIDPATRTYVVILANRLRPGTPGDVRPLRARIASLVADAFRPENLDPARTARDRDGAAFIEAAPAVPRVRPGIDVLAAAEFAPLVGKRVGLITNRSGRDSAGRRTIDLLNAASGVRLVALFTPEHGLEGEREGKIASGREKKTGLPLYSLYGETRRPTRSMLEGLDALVFDVQDAGVRFYTYVTTMAYAMEAAAARGLSFFVLDRPNPISAAVVQGPVLDPDLRSFTGYYPLPVRHGMTIGELARMLNAELRIGADLHVVAMQGYRRSDWYDETGLEWVAPSPNLRSIDQAALYPAVALLEGANVSVGRGTATPFEVLGAPWIDGPRLASHLRGRAVAGVRFEAADFTPEQEPFRRQECHGVRLVLTDRRHFDAPLLGVELANALHRLHGRSFRLGDTLELIGSRRVVRAIEAGEDPRRIARQWEGSLATFLDLRARYLLY